MTQKFDDLHAAALARADAALTHIAETEQLSGEQSARITARALEKAGFPTRTTTAAAAVQPAIRHRKRTKLLGALIAAALSVTVLAVGVGGYLRYNKAAMEKNFGMLGTTRLDELGLAEPKTYTNGKVSATVEAVLSDGTNAYALMVFKAADPAEPVDWKYQLYTYHEKGCAADTYQTAFPSHENVQEFDGEAWLTMEIALPEEHVGDTLTLCFEKQETGFPEEDAPLDMYESPEFVGSHVQYFNDLTDGLEIDLPLRANIPVLTMRAADGTALRLSGFEIIAPSQSLLMGDGGNITLYRSDGTQTAGWIPVAVDGGAQYITQAGEKKIDYRKPETWCGFTDLTDVTAVEVGGVMYSRVQ